MTTEEEALRLFDVPGGEDTPTGAERLSADRRRTLRRAEAIAAGKHPLRLDPLLTDPPDETCGSCDYVVGHGHNLRTYWKCNLIPTQITAGAASDVRLSWPACIRWQGRPTTTPTEG